MSDLPADPDLQAQRAFLAASRRQHADAYVMAPCLADVVARAGRRAAFAAEPGAGVRIDELSGRKMPSGAGGPGDAVRRTRALGIDIGASGVRATVWTQGGGLAGLAATTSASAGGDRSTLATWRSAMETIGHPASSSLTCYNTSL